MKRHTIVICFISLVSLSVSTSLRADSVGLNFVGGQPFFTPPSGPVTGTAGAPGFAQDNWNNLGSVGVPSGSATNLVDAAGVSTGIGVAWTSVDSWQALAGSAPTTQDQQLMNGYLDNTIQITLTGLTFGSYDVVVYFNGDTPSDDRVYHYQIGSTSIFAQDNAAFTGTYIQVPGTSNTDQGINTPAGNYTVFSDISGASFTLDATPENPDDPAGRSVINAIQIIQTPEPQSALLLLTGLAAFLVIGLLSGFKASQTND
jgi:hypothetical protein